MKQKEQAAGDYQNLICIIMHECQVDLQSAVNKVTSMILQRVQDYVRLKRQLPSFGADVDRQLSLYLKALEHEVHGYVQWCYESPRESRREVSRHCLINSTGYHGGKTLDLDDPSGFRVDLFPHVNNSSTA
jgi:hypothetical protein